LLNGLQIPLQKAVLGCAKIEKSDATTDICVPSMNRALSHEAHKKTSGFRRWLLLAVTQA
jgi:hypothetical protein